MDLRVGHDGSFGSIGLDEGLDEDGGEIGSGGAVGEIGSGGAVVGKIGSGILLQGFGFFTICSNL